MFSPTMGEGDLYNIVLTELSLKRVSVTSLRFTEYDKYANSEVGRLLTIFGSVILTILR